MVPLHIALVADDKNRIDVQELMRDLSRVSSALQKQVTRDFGPLWNIEATVDAFTDLNDVPLDYWPIIVRHDIPDHALGFHIDEQGQPYSLVRYTTSWSLTASHECLEMLADPFGNRLIAGPSPRNNANRVQYLVEICDPCESADYAYTVNDILVSDFYTPHFFDPERVPGVRYSFSGRIQEPRQVLPGGYISWLDPVDNHIWQLRHLGPDEEFIDLGQAPAGLRSLREMVDSQTPRTSISYGLSEDSKMLGRARNKAWNTGERTARRAQCLSENIERLYQSPNVLQRV